MKFHFGFSGRQNAQLASAGNDLAPSANDRKAPLQSFLGSLPGDLAYQRLGPLTRRTQQAIGIAAHPCDGSLTYRPGPIDVLATALHNGLPVVAAGRISLEQEAPGFGFELGHRA
jgi:hypothetical protein